MKILERFLHRLADEGIGGKVHHGIRLARLECGADLGLARQIALYESGFWMHCGAVALIKVVKDCDIVSLLNEFLCGDAADISGAACD
jgi:hypothetical protein